MFLGTSPRRRSAIPFSAVVLTLLATLMTLALIGQTPPIHPHLILQSRADLAALSAGLDDAHLASAVDTGFAHGIAHGYFEVVGTDRFEGELQFGDGKPTANARPATGAVHFQRRAGSWAVTNAAASAAPIDENLLILTRRDFAFLRTVLSQSIDELTAEFDRGYSLFHITAFGRAIPGQPDRRFVLFRFAGPSATRFVLISADDDGSRFTSLDTVRGG